VSASGQVFKKKVAISYLHKSAWDWNDSEYSLLSCYLLHSELALILACYVTALTFLCSHISFPGPALFSRRTVAAGRREHTSPLHSRRQHFCFERCSLLPTGTRSSSSSCAPNTHGCFPSRTGHAAGEPGREQSLPQSQAQALASAGVRAAEAGSASSSPRLPTQGRWPSFSSPAGSGWSI